MLIAFSGTKLAGKDTGAEVLIKRHGFKRIGLADKLKDICSDVFNIPRAHMDDPAMKECPFKAEVTLTVVNIDSLLRTIARDGFDFDFETTFRNISKNFQGKNLTSIRDMLQTVGTDICRSFIKDDIWLEYVKKELTPESNIVITDARFQNERDYLRNIGAILVLVHRPGFESKSSHVSENQLGNPSDYDVIVTNDSTIISLQSSISMWYDVKRYELLSYPRR